MTRKGSQQELVDMLPVSIFCKQILQAEKSIRFAGIANNLGSLIAKEYREG
jgi:hypothetical protein